MNLIFAGVQGSGKGTQAKIIAKELGLEHVSTGDLLRGASGNLKQEIDSYTTKGNLVPDELILRLLKEKISHLDKGIILDGFPRNLKQAKMLNNIMKVDKIINIKISDKEAKRRIKGRFSCKKCGILYNIVTAPRPKQERICDKCSSELFQRDDDSDDNAIEKRLKIYYDETNSILKKYPHIEINGEQNIEKVTEDILDSLE